MTDISVLIPFLNEERHLPVCVPRMLDQDFAGEVEFLFIDGASTDGGRAVLERLATRDARIRVLDNPARHTAAGLNVGLDAARGRYVARMDAHTHYPRGYLRTGVERLERGGVEWVTGPQVPAPDGVWSRRVALALAAWAGRGQSEKWPGGSEAGDATEFPLRTSVFCGVWRRETLEALGGWDEGWPVNQDAEMAARVLAGGGQIVCRTDMGADYVPRNSLRGLARQYGRYGFYRSKTFMRHPESLPRSRVLPVGVTLAIAAAVVPLGPLRRPARLGLGAYLLAVSALSTRALSRTRVRRDAAWLPLVFATMHVSWGAGFLLGLTRHLPRRRELKRWPPARTSRPGAR
jgi:glycosyltransferase involved in cell wall biosynthesis